ncbi:ABC transporter ATP-binding protein [Aliamphritea hakodatensis]|uniref:ABC transporter ATP-binding protein n=1 Tax=Aliamphritea hakodatensis TaxID=2895352 RepID=UPI0022FD5D66|nr:ABC transporter ATP-binding protein [Aliamphritea hakodatensis]
MNTQSTTFAVENDSPAMPEAVSSAADILSLRNVNKLYGDFVAVSNVSLDLKQGEFLTFLGPSGSGKTTTLMMVAGFTGLSSGSIMLDGKPLDPLPPHKRDLGMVFQQYALFPHMTVEQNVAFPLQVRKLGRDVIEEKVRASLEQVGLSQYGDRLPKQLSGGQQQRVALARAMVFEPRLLLMDEPLGALDKKLREHMQIEIMRLHREMGITVIYVTHDQEEALAMSDRIAVFNEGEIKQIGSPSELYKQPNSRFVADFIGESNFIEGTITSVIELADSDTGVAVGTVETAIGPLQARLGSELAVNCKVSLAVRPERIWIVAPDTPDNCENIVSARVTDVVYLGQQQKYVVRLNNGDEMTVMQQLNRATSGEIAVGSEIQLAWTAEASVLLAD